MNYMTTLGKVFDRVDKMSKDCTDRLAPVSKISFNSLKSMNIDGDTHTLKLVAQKAIANTDQGSQFTSFLFTQVLKDAQIKISMDGKGRWMDNIMIERLWRSLNTNAFISTPLK